MITITVKFGKKLLNFAQFLEISANLIYRLIYLASNYKLYLNATFAAECSFTFAFNFCDAILVNVVFGSNLNLYWYANIEAKYTNIESILEHGTNIATILILHLASKLVILHIWETRHRARVSLAIIALYFPTTNGSPLFADQTYRRVVLYGRGFYNIMTFLQACFKM